MEKKEISILGSMDYSSLLQQIVATNAINKSKLTKKQVEERERESKKHEEMRVRKAKVMNNICPDCDGKLNRGKKEKELNYERTWKCGCCEGSFMSNGEKVIENAFKRRAK
ncbi:hypothetical protein AAHH67_15550 [Niallia circulans]